MRTISSCAVEKTKDGLTNAYYNIQTKLSNEPKKFPYASARASPRETSQEGAAQKIKDFVKNTGESVIYYGQGVVELIKSSYWIKRRQSSSSLVSVVTTKQGRPTAKLCRFFSSYRDTVWR